MMRAMEVVVLRSFVAAAKIDEMYLERVRKLIVIVESFTTEATYRQFHTDVQRLKASGLPQQEAMMKLLGKYTV